MGSPRLPCVFFLGDKYIFYFICDPYCVYASLSSPFLCARVCVLAFVLLNSLTFCFRSG